MDFVLAVPLVVYWAMGRIMQCWNHLGPGRGVIDKDSDSDNHHARPILELWCIASDLAETRAGSVLVL